MVMRKCGACRGPIRETHGRGRLRMYCSQVCRQRAYEIRKAQRQLLGELGEHHLGHPAPRTDLPPLPLGAWRGVLHQLRYQLRATTIDPGDRNQILHTLRVILTDHELDEPRSVSRPGPPSANVPRTRSRSGSVAAAGNHIRAVIPATPRPAAPRAPTVAAGGTTGARPHTDSCLEGPRWRTW